MNTSSALCKFSPLRTPDVKKAKKKTLVHFAATSDTESLASVTTREIRSLAQSVTTKMAKKSVIDSSDEDIFITQKKYQTDSCDKNKTKGKKKRVSESFSGTDLSLSDSSSEDNDKSAKKRKKKSTNDNREKEINGDKRKEPVIDKDIVDTSSLAGDSDAESAIIADMSQPRVKVKAHDISDSDDGSDSDIFTKPAGKSNSTDKLQAHNKVSKNKRKSTDTESESPKKSKTKTSNESGSPKKSKNKETISVSSSSKKIKTKETVSEHRSESSNKTKLAQSKSYESDSSSLSSLSDSDDDENYTKIKSTGMIESPKKTSSSSNRSSKKGYNSEDKSLNSVKSPSKGLNGSPSSGKVSDSSKQRRKSGIFDHSHEEEIMEVDETSRESAESAVNEMGDGPATKTKLRYAFPENFTLETAERIEENADLENKEIFLITAPEDFDMTTLDGKKLKMKGEQIVNTGDEGEKQFEITYMPKIQEQRSSMCTLLADTENGKESLIIGPDVIGEIKVMQWVPAMPPTEIIKTKRDKHRVPDNLKQTFKPFGSCSPERETLETETVHRSHKKSKKAKKRHRETSESQDQSMKDDKNAGHSHLDSSIDKTGDNIISESEPTGSEKKKKKKKKHKKKKDSE